MSMTVTENVNVTLHETQDEKVKKSARTRIWTWGRLGPAFSIFIVPIVIAAVAALPSVFVLLIIHAFMGLLTQLLHLNQQIRLFDSYFYIFIFSPAIVLGAAAFVVSLIAYWKSTGNRISREGREAVCTVATGEGFHPQILETLKR